jgi:hypothetical protein
MKDYLNLLDLAELPPTQRKIMRLVMRKVEISYADLCVAVEALPESDRLSQAELDQVLQTLGQENWLVRVEKDQLVTYKANLRRNPGSKETNKPKRNIWDVLSLGDEPARSGNKPDR